MTTSLDVMRYIRVELGVSNRLVRQKLLYFTQGWNLAWTGRPLYSDDVEAWQNGPVVYQAWRADKDIAPDCDNRFPGRPLSDDERAVVDQVWAHYRHLTSDEIKDLSHEEPWEKIWNDPNITGRRVMPKSDLRSWFMRKALICPQADQPIKPATAAPGTDPCRFREVADRELARWKGANRLLAAR